MAQFDLQVRLESVGDAEVQVLTNAYASRRLSAAAVVTVGCIGVDTILPTEADTRRLLGGSRASRLARLHVVCHELLELRDPAPERFDLGAQLLLRICQCADRQDGD